MKLVPILAGKYEYYKQRLMFEGYKWDPQFLDNNTVARHVLVLTENEAKELADYTRKLAKETMEAEEFINDNLHLAKILKLPKRLKKEVKSMSNYDRDKHVRLMRFDFHPVKQGGFAVSEVNSDVPGGHSEASIIPAIAKEILEEAGDKDRYSYIDLSDYLMDAISKKIKPQGTIFLNYCTCYSDDRQVMEFVGDRLAARGFKVLKGAADHINFKDGKAYSILDGNECELDGVFRYTPIEWIMDIKPKRWQGYFNTDTPSINHPISLYAQTKRFPFVWETLEENGVDMSTWKKLLPHTVEAKAVLSGNNKKAKHLKEKYSQNDYYGEHRDEYIFKPAYGRVGEKISIKEACREDEFKKILKDVKRHPKKYIAQKKFDSMPLVTEEGEEFHVCIGSFSVDESHAGFYARISNLPRIDSHAADIPVLVEKDENQDENIKVKDIYSEDYLKRNYHINLSWNVYKAFVEKDNQMVGAKQWSNWVRPVPFINIGMGKKNYSYNFREQHVFDLRDEAMKPFTKDTAVIVDIPGANSINAGMHLAKEGFRPIPIYNGIIEEENSKSVVDNQTVSEGLMWMAKELSDIKICDDAMPAFLLDSNRLMQYKSKISVYDNSWDVYRQDMPSGEYLINNSVKRILLISDRISGDLRKILINYRKAGLDIYLKKIYDEPKRIKVRRMIRLKNR